MQLSAEIRWFWRESPPPGFQDWFCGAGAHACAAGGGGLRTDQYLRETNQGELGIKRRSNHPGVEIKGLVQADFYVLSAPPITGQVELWAKWTGGTFGLPPGETATIEKVRWMRKYITNGKSVRELPLDVDEMPLGGEALPEQGCNVELTQIHLDNVEWWTFGFEAFGQINTLKRSILMAAKSLAPLIPLGGALCASYPAWFCSIYGGSQ